MKDFESCESCKDMGEPKALVIGGSGSLGSETCRILVQKGFDVALTYYSNLEKAENLRQDLTESAANVHIFRLDLNNIENTKRVIRQADKALGRIDSLVITSGLATGREKSKEVSKFLDVTPEEYDKMMGVNVRGVFFACQEIARIMSAAGGGRIVIVGSIDGVKPVPSPVDYACCKGALWAITQSLSKELGSNGILVNMVAPGILEGGIAELLSRDLMTEYLKHCSLGRVGSFSEIAKVIAFLAGPKNSYLTGQALILDGGL